MESLLNIDEAIKLLSIEAARTADIRSIRLDQIIERLNRVKAGDYYNSNDLSTDEQEANSMEALRKHVIENFDDEYVRTQKQECACELFRCKVDNEGEGYYFTGYTSLPGVDFETYHNFYDNRDECICGKESAGEL